MTYDDERDTTIADALDQVAVPDHAPGFWAELDDRLAAEAPVVPLRRLGRYGRAPRLLAIAAAVVVLAAATAVLLAQDDGPQTVRVTPADPSTSTTTDDTAVGPTTTTQAPATTTTTTTPPPTAKRGEATPDGAVSAWLTALNTGDIDTAQRLTGPDSEAYITSLGGNVRGFLEESQEGYGGWDDSGYMSSEIELKPLPDGVERVVVVVSGDYQGEGDDGYRTDALPTARVGRDGTWLVEFTAFEPKTGGRIEMISPSAGESGLNGLAADATIQAAATGNGVFAFSLDESPAVHVAGTRSGGKSRATWDPPGDMASRSHLLLVAYVDGNTFTAFTGVFAVEG